MPSGPNGGTKLKLTFTANNEDKDNAYANGVSDDD